MSLIKKIVLIFFLSIIFFLKPEFSKAQAGFVTPDTVCVNTAFQVINTSTGVTNYYWSFCAADFNSTPEAINLGNPGNLLANPVFTDLAQDDNGDYYEFVTNHVPGELIRLNFGNSYLNNPVADYLGNFAGLIHNQTEGIQILKANGKWYAILVGGGNQYPNSAPCVVTIDFGISLSNPAPTAVNWGNVGNLNLPHDLFVFKEGNNYYGYTINVFDNTITRLDFGSGFDNAPVGINLGNIGNLSYPAGFGFVQYNNNWFAFVCNRNSNSITRLDFGTSLLNTPTGTNITIPGNVLQRPRDISVFTVCDGIYGFVVNEQNNSLVKLNFGFDLTSVPQATSLGNAGNFNFPHSLSKFFREKNDIYSFIANANNNTLSRIRFTGCQDIPGSDQQNPPIVSYDRPGIYDINLLADLGLPSQTSFCKSIYVMDCAVTCSANPDFTFQQDVCNPGAVQFTNETPNTLPASWDFGNGYVINNTNNPFVIFANYGTYPVKMIVEDSSGCVDSVTKLITITIQADSIITTPVMTICSGDSLQLNTVPALSYCWFPSAGLSNTAIANPVAVVSSPTTYYLNAQTLGSNLILNGDFSEGNIGFSSEYSYSTSNTSDGQYFVGTSPLVWNPNLTNCTDHTGMNGNMLLVNGSNTNSLKLWCQTLNVVPNTNYAFSAWVQNLDAANMEQIQFYINGNILRNIYSANPEPCNWKQLFTTWNSGTNSVVNICIINKNKQAQSGVFAFDDISFSEVKMNSDMIHIDVSSTPAIFAGPDTSVCNGLSVQLHATGTQNYSWINSHALSDTSIANPVASPDSTSQFIVKGYNNSTCFALDTVKVTVVPLPVFSMSNDTAICIGSTIVLSANGNDISTYSWTPPGTLSNPSIPDPVAAPADTTKYFVTVTSNSGCTAIDSVLVNVSPMPSITLIPDTTICYGSSVILSTNSDGNSDFSWSPATGLDNPNISNPAARPNTNIVYKVSAENGICSIQDSVAVNVLSLPVVTITDDTTICGTGQVQLNASGGNLYLWYPSEGLSATDISNPVASPANSTQYYVEVKGVNSCLNFDSVLITIKTNADFFVTPSVTGICPGDTIMLSVSGGDSFQWYPPETVASPSSASSEVYPSVNTIYSIVVTDSECKITDTISAVINIDPMPYISVSKSNDVDCVLGQAELKATGGVHYNWFPSSSLSNPNISNPVAAPSETTVYHVKMTDVNGCKAEDSIEVKVITGSAENGYFLASAFTPNGDGLNDCFGIKEWGYVTDLDFSIYDRWGNMVFHTTDPSRCWDGTNKGVMQTTSTFIYQVRAKTICGNVSRRGTIVLIR